ncbi:MAG TPA: metal ABC transporter substrate-binding protein [Candidatus Limnocylindrales bacterium]|nr:metal ABC transporter substrate-binding protein [Candidatus Limnocylindrales bacterium]
MDRQIPSIRGRRALAAVVAMVVAVSACGPATGGSGSPGDDDRIRVVTTSTVFADLVARTGGDRVAVTSLVPAGVDPHTYQASPSDLRAAADADLFVMNGLGLDDWLEDTIRAAAADAPILRLAEAVSDDVELLPGETDDERNPHLWMDVTIAEQYVAGIWQALKAADPAHPDELEASWTAYAQTLVDLDGWIREQMATIPAANRKIVTFHDALPYFARAYGLTVVGVAVEAPGQDPSAGEIAALIDAIRTAGVKAIFSEDQFPTALVDQIARETGATVVADLYDDSLGDPPVTSYEAMLRWDVEHFVEALR